MAWQALKLGISVGLSVFVELAYMVVMTSSYRHRCKKRFLILVTFFYFPNVFFNLKNVGKVQVGKQINKKHFQNNSSEIDL